MTPFYTILTNYGKTTLAEALAAQKPLEIPHMAAGDGGGAYYDPVEEQTNLRNELWRGDLNDLRTDEGVQGQVIAEAIIPMGIDGDWTVREIGLFDAKGGLIAVGKYPENYIPPASSGAKSQVHISIIIKIDNVAAVQLIVDHGQVLASKLYVAEITKKSINEMRQELLLGDGSLIGVEGGLTLKEKLAERLTTSSFHIYGNTSIGCTDDLLKAINQLKSVNQPLRFVNGIYLIDKDLIIDVPLEVPFGAFLKVPNGVQLTLTEDLDAGNYQIFETEDDFYSFPANKTSIKLSRHEVKPEWFGAKTVTNILDILTVPDSSHAILKAHRAAIGDYANPYGNDFWSEFPYSHVVLANGCYRCDRPIQFGYQERIEGVMVRYKANGSGIQGKGSGLSLLVFTDSDYKGNAHFTASYMSGEMHKYNGFKVGFCNPTLSGSDRFYSYAGAMMLFTSIDSIETADLWASGGYYSYVNTDGVTVGGVGIQFESLTDHRYRDILTEHNVHGVAFSSCLSNGTNIKGFFNKVADVSFGNFIPAWGSPTNQNTTNNVSLSGLKSKACSQTPLYFGTKENYIDIEGLSISGLGESSSVRVTARTIGFNVKGGGAYGRISGKVSNVNYGLFTDNGSSYAGRVGAQLQLNFTVKDALAKLAYESAVVNIENPESNVDLTLSLDGTDWLPAVRNYSPHTQVSLSLKNVKNPNGAIAFLNKDNGAMLIKSLSESGGVGAWLGYMNGGTVLMPVIYNVSNSTVRHSGGVIRRSSVENYPHTV